MSEISVEPEALPSTSQTADIQKTAIIPLVSMPKIVLTRIDLENLPTPVYLAPSSPKKPVKRLTEKKKKPLVTKTLPNKTVDNVRHDTRFRGKPKKNYKFLSEVGKSPIELSTSKIKNGKISGIVKKVPKLTAKTVDKEESNTVKGLLKKTMLQKRSKIAIPPAKKPKLMPKKQAKALIPKPKKENVNIVASTVKKEVSPKIKDFIFKNRPMDTDASEDEFLYDELIDELVNPPRKKVSVTEKTTNITLKPNVGNKPPTIVKGGIVKKSSLPPDLKAVASPATLNSSKVTGTSLSSTNKPIAFENIVKTPATAETPKASLPSKASPFPISINSSPTKTGPKAQSKKSAKKSAKTTSIIKEDPPQNFYTSKGSISQTKVTENPKYVGKSITTPARPRGRPRIGPKQVTEPVLKIAAEDESDEYTEVETLENVDSEPVEPFSNPVSGSGKNDDVHVITLTNSNGTVEFPGTKSKKDDDPHLDLLRILTDDSDDVAQSETNESKEVQSGNSHNNPEENPKPGIISSPNNSETRLETSNIGNPGSLEIDNSSDLRTQELSTAQVSEENLNHMNYVSDPPVEAVVEETPHIRTIYDLMSEVSLQYPSWNLHIIPETNAFCIAQVTKGRLGLPTLKKCIELDPDTYSAKVYIHQYHIKRFDGVYDSEEAILALIEEIHSIKA